MNVPHPRHILITGASSGIGEGLAITYARHGVTLYLTGQNEERLASVAKRCQEKGATIFTNTVNVCDRTAMNQWIATICAEHPLDLVIANAGISGGFDGQSLERITDDYKIFDTNLNGVLNTIYPVIPVMVSQKSGQIVIISSLASFMPMPSAPAYAASKAAVRFYGEALTVKLAPYGIAVSVVCPGFIKSRMTDKNTFPMPFLMETEPAVALIKGKIDRKIPFISFPLPMILAIKCMTILPRPITRAIFAWLPNKKSLPNL